MDPPRDSLSAMLQNDPSRSNLLRSRLGTAPQWSADLLKINVTSPSVMRTVHTHPIPILGFCLEVTDWVNETTCFVQGCLLNSLGRSEGDVDTYVQQLQQREQQTAGNASTACTAIWKPGVLAYRCRTCQVNDNCAICQECFQVQWLQCKPVPILGLVQMCNTSARAKETNWVAVYPHAGW